MNFDDTRQVALYNAIRRQLSLELCASAWDDPCDTESKIAKIALGIGRTHKDACVEVDKAFFVEGVGRRWSDSGDSP